MLATKLSSVCRMSAGMLLKPSLAAAPRTPLTQLARGFREAGRPFTRRSKLREAQAQVVETTQTTKGKIGRKYFPSNLMLCRILHVFSSFPLPSSFSFYLLSLVAAKEKWVLWRYAIVKGMLAFCRHLLMPSIQRL